MCSGCYTEEPLGREWYNRMNHFYDLYPEADFGPAHIVIGDDNLEDHHILYCLEKWDKMIAEHDVPRDPVDLAAAWCWLKYLLTFPESERLTAQGVTDDPEDEENGRMTDPVPPSRIAAMLNSHRYAGNAA